MAHGKPGSQQQFTILESERIEDGRHPGCLGSTSTCFNLAKGLMEKGSVTIRDSRYGNSDISKQQYAVKITRALSDIVLHSRATRANSRNHYESI